jgi:RHS repeat-associated protein
MRATDGTTTTNTYSVIDAIGDRLGASDGTTIGFLVPDLHGNVVALIGSGATPAFSAAYAYDAYGETVASWPTGGSALKVPWRFQGRILESSSVGTDLYDFGARSYDPSLGALTSFDSVSGSAVNPLTLNRYLYADANPATLVDPDGHSVCRYDGEDCRTIARANASKPRFPALSGTTDMTTGVDNFRSWSANTDMTSAVDNFRSDTGAGACRWSQTAEECKNIAAEDHYNQYFAACQDGDKSACTKKDSIKVDTGDPSASFHILLGAASFVPIVGSLAAAADTALYLAEGNYQDAALTAPGMVPGGAITKGLKFVRGGEDAAKAATAGAKGFNGLTKAEEYGVKGAKALRADIGGTGLQAHHLIEQRFAGALEQAASKMASIAVTAAEHQAFTNAWRRAIPYGAGTAEARQNPQRIWDEARRIYENYPAILSALGL